MKFGPLTRRRKIRLGVFAAALGYIAYRQLAPYPELVVEIGETYEVMVERSSVDFDPLIPTRFWGGEVHSAATLRFVDPQYGFTTPAGRTFTVTFDNNVAGTITISPQIKPQMFDDALKLVLDLQDQWRQAGWTLQDPERRPAIADTPEGRDKLLTAPNGTTVFWQAGQSYKVMLTFIQDLDERHPSFKPENQRYRVSLQVSRPRIPPPRPLESSVLKDQLEQSIREIAAGAPS